MSNFIESNSAIADPLPVAVIGSGPVGLAAAAHLLARGETPLVLEAGDAVGASIRQMGPPALMKSYGRAPTFLLLTGYEQVRSVVAAIAGDWESAHNVELVLPETGVCSTGTSRGESDAGGGITDAATLPAFNKSEALLLPVLGTVSLPSPAPTPSRTGLLTISLASVAATTSCCSTYEQTTCCEPGDKASCCGSETALAGAGCGCR